MEIISVVIPVYNVEQYLRECLDSVVGQTYPYKEILLINDGSTDSSAVICEEYAKRYSFIKVFYKLNEGPSVARNCGIEASKGEWIIFMDADDVWADKDCLSKLHNYAVNLDLDVVRFEYQSVNENLKPIEPRLYDKSVIEGQAVDNYNLVKYGIAGEWFTVLFLIKRGVISDIRFNINWRFLEDCDFYCRIFASRSLRCGYLDEKMYLYRKIPQSISQTVDVTKLQASFALCDTFYSTSCNIANNNLSQLYCYNAVMMYYWTLQTLAAVPYYDNREDIIKELELDALHSRVISWLKHVSIDWKYRIFICPKPRTGVIILHLKDKIRALMS